MTREAQLVTASLLETTTSTKQALLVRSSRHQRHTLKTTCMHIHIQKYIHTRDKTVLSLKTGNPSRGHVLFGMNKITVSL